MANIDEKVESLSAHSHKFRPDTKLPNISVKKYRISLLDGQNSYTLKGDTFKIYDFVLNEKIKLKANGDLILNNRKQISYNISWLRCFSKNYFRK